MELLRFPERRLSVVVLCNIANADVEGFARKISDLYLEKELRSEADSPARSSLFPDLAPFAGTYLDPRKHIIYTFTAGSGNLMGWGSKLQRLGASEFSDLVGNLIVFESAKGTMTATLTLQGDPYFSGDMVPQIQFSESALSRFTGNYHSDELEATYELSLIKGVLMQEWQSNARESAPGRSKRISGGRPRNDCLQYYYRRSRPRTDPFLATRTRHCFRQRGLGSRPQT